MSQKYKILLNLILSLLLGTPSISAQIVDEQGQYVDTTFHDNVDRMAVFLLAGSLKVWLSYEEVRER